MKWRGAKLVRRVRVRVVVEQKRCKRKVAILDGMRQAGVVVPEPRVHGRSIRDKQFGKRQVGPPRGFP
jgi:tRNA A-37 threonylcarbamoyl transferase component Bud32